MSKIISIGQAAELLGVHVQTLRNWEKSGKLKPDSISPGGGQGGTVRKQS